MMQIANFMAQNSANAVNISSRSLLTPNLHLKFANWNEIKF